MRRYSVLYKSMNFSESLEEKTALDVRNWEGCVRDDKTEEWGKRDLPLYRSGHRAISFESLGAGAGPQINPPKHMAGQELVK